MEVEMRFGVFGDGEMIANEERLGD